VPLPGHPSGSRHQEIGADTAIPTCIGHPLIGQLGAHRNVGAQLDLAGTLIAAPAIGSSCHRVRSSQRTARLRRIAGRWAGRPVRPACRRNSPAGRAASSMSRWTASRPVPSSTRGRCQRSRSGANQASRSATGPASSNATVTRAASRASVHSAIVQAGTAYRRISRHSSSAANGPATIVPPGSLALACCEDPLTLFMCPPEGGTTFVPFIRCDRVDLLRPCQVLDTLESSNHSVKT
jgi:hypothetical protein